MTTTKAKLLTADDLLELHSKGIRGELIRGVLCQTMATGVNHGKVVMKLGFLLGSAVFPQRLGTLIGSDTGILLRRAPDTIREPDIAFFSAERMSLGIDMPGYSEIIPDLVVEIMAHNDAIGAVYDKARMWLSNGVPLVWVAHPDWREVEVHPLGGAVFTLTDTDTLDGGDILPGFTCKVSDIFDV